MSDAYPSATPPIFPRPMMAYRTGRPATVRGSPNRARSACHAKEAAASTTCSARAVSRRLSVRKSEPKASASVASRALRM